MRTRRLSIRKTLTLWMFLHLSIRLLGMEREAVVSPSLLFIRIEVIGIDEWEMMGLAEGEQ